MPLHAQPDPVERVAFSTREFAEAFGVTRQHVQNLIARGELRSVKLGRRRLIPRGVVDELLAGRLSEPDGRARQLREAAATRQLTSPERPELARLESGSR